MKWYKSNWFVILSLIFFFPLGLFLMWYFKKWSLMARIIVTIVIAIISVISFLVDPPESNNTINFDTPKEVSTKNEKNNNAKPKTSNEEKIKASVKKELNTGEIEIIGYSEGHANILISTSSNVSENMTSKEVKHILGDTLVGLQKSKVDLNSANIGVKVDGSRVVSSKWSKKSIQKAEDYKYKIYKDPSNFADQYTNNIE